jgi:hypothetical protein
MGGIGGLEIVKPADLSIAVEAIKLGGRVVNYDAQLYIKMQVKNWL